MKLKTLWVASIALISGLMIESLVPISAHAGWLRVQRSGVYGWDVRCVDAQGLQVSARQSDDDFYVVWEGAGYPKTTEWADPSQQYKASLQNLLFVHDPANGGTTPFTLALHRNSILGASHGSGVLRVGERLHHLNCYIRFGKTEEEFEALSQRPFPKIPAPTPGAGA